MRLARLLIFAAVGWGCLSCNREHSPASGPTENYNEVGNGGEICEMEYRSFIPTVHEWFLTSLGEEVSAVRADHFLNTLLKTKVRCVASELYLDGGVKTAVSYSKQELTKVNFGRWAAANRSAKQALVTHEGLVLVGLEATDDYHLSQNVWHRYEGQKSPLVALSTVESSRFFGMFIFDRGTTYYSPPFNSAFPTSDSQLMASSLKPFVFWGFGWGRNLVALVQAGRNLAVHVQSYGVSDVYGKVEYSYRIDAAAPTTVTIDGTTIGTEIPIPENAKSEVTVTAFGIRATGERVPLGRGTASVLSRWVRQLDFELPAGAAPKKIGDAGSATLRINYDKNRMAILGCDAPKMFVTAKIQFLDSQNKLLLAEDVSVGGFTELTRETFLVKTPSPATQMLIWFEGSNQFSSKKTPDCLDGAMENPFRLALEP